MIGAATNYGRRCHCPKTGCTYVWWDNGKINSPANQAMRNARQQAHRVFDQLWKAGHMSRKQCYNMLAEWMGKRPGSTHIGLFTVKECERVVEFAREQLQHFSKQHANQPQKAE